MCMIAHRFLSKKGKGSNIPNTVIDTALTRHPDGYGVAWRDPEYGLVYEKFGPTERADFRALLKEIDSDKSIEYVAHFRYATHGPEDKDHAHPYVYEDPDPAVGRVLVFHNGIIGGVTTKPSESDTEVFVRDWLAKLPSRWWTSAGIRKLVDHMGGWSKLVLMTDTETVNLNHYSGEEDGGLWYSSEHRGWSYGTGYSTGGWGDDDDWESGTYRTAAPVMTKSAEIGVTTNPRGNVGVWMHQGHELSPLQTFDFSKDGDYECGVVCDTCGTAGDVYIIDGKAYIDIPHAWDVERGVKEPEGLIAASAVDEDEIALNPDDMEDLLPSDGKGLTRAGALKLLSSGGTPTSEKGAADSCTPVITMVAGASGQNYARIN